ncbi:MAG: CotH kinase family protein, partial [Candidatus Gracilibacteria bacterium]
MKKMLIQRHKWLPITFLFLTLGGVWILGDFNITAYTSSDTVQLQTCTANQEGIVDLFDETQVHEIQILGTDDLYETLNETYLETDRKDYFAVDVIIDGTRLNNVGIRLKGNASLRTAVGGGMGGFEPPEGMDFPEGFQPPEGMEFPEGFEPPAGFGPQGGFHAQEVLGQKVSEGITADSQKQESNNIPYLLKFDEFVTGQCYGGYSEIALRTSGISKDESLLQEPVTNEVLNSVGILAPKSVYVALQLTASSDPLLYTLAEQPDQHYIDEYFPESNSVLYKVIQVGNDFSYLGEDPTAYAEIFEQKTAINDADMTPLIKFIRFVSESTDEEFAAQLDDYLEVIAFADYLAAQNLLSNSDSLAGMGNNYYLYYDFNTERFTILSWDANESLGKLGMGGGASLGIYWENDEQFGQMFEVNVNAEVDGDQNQRGKGGMNKGNHLLKERFLATPKFLTLYEERYRLLYEEIYEQDLITPIIDKFVAVVSDYNAGHAVVDSAAFEKAVESVRTFVEERHAYLKTTELLAPSTTSFGSEKRLASFFSSLYTSLDAKHDSYHRRGPPYRGFGETLLRKRGLS